MLIPFLVKIESIEDPAHLEPSAAVTLTKPSSTLPQGSACSQLIRLAFRGLPVFRTLSWMVPIIENLDSSTF